MPPFGHIPNVNGLTPVEDRMPIIAARLHKNVVASIQAVPTAAPSATSAAEWQTASPGSTITGTSTAAQSTDQVQAVEGATPDQLISNRVSDDMSTSLNRANDKVLGEEWRQHHADTIRVALNEYKNIPPRPHFPSAGLLHYAEKRCRRAKRELARRDRDERKRRERMDVEEWE